MSRLPALLTCVALVAAGCSQPKASFEPPQKPTPPAQLTALERLVGTWEGTAEMVQPSAEDMKQMMPEGEDMTTTFRGEGTTEWTLGGMYLTSHGWHEMGDGEKMHMTEYWTWDPKAQKYRTWFFSDWGEYGEGWAHWSKDGESLHMTGHGVSHQGKKKFEGKMTFVNDDTVKWVWSEKAGPFGKTVFKIKGTSHKK